MERVLITGADGFIGSALVRRLVVPDGFWVRTAVRSPSKGVSLSQETVQVGDINNESDWNKTLLGIDTVIHLAARAHVLKESSYSPLDEFRRVNVWGTKRLTTAAAECGVKRFIYLSSIGVVRTISDTLLREESELRPGTPYGISKAEAENAIREIARETGIEIVILRPPLVYGPGVPGNFMRLLSIVNKKVPLPLGRVKNMRSFIYIGNLVDAIIKCIQHPSAANKTFLVSDGEDLSTPELIRRLASALNKPARLVPVPPSLLRLAGAVTRKSAEVERLTGSLVIDSSKIRRELNWTPPFTVDEGLKRTAEWYVEAKRKVGS